MSIGLIDFEDGSVKTPYTNADGESKEFYQNYIEIVNSIADLEKMFRFGLTVHSLKFIFCRKAQ